MSFECWINTPNTKSDYQHQLLFAGGEFAGPNDTTPRFHVLQIFIDAKTLYQAFITAGTTNLWKNSTFVSQDMPTHFVARMSKDPNNGETIVELVVNGKSIDKGSIGVFSRPDGAPLFIGIMNNNTSGDVDPTHAVPLFPAEAIIQEVVLYNRMLTDQEIQTHINLNKKSP